MNYSAVEIWFLILAIGLGTFLIRLSFLGLIGNREMPEWLLRHLRYTPVAVLPGLVAPLVFFPPATGGVMDPLRLAAAVVTLVVGLWTRSALWAIAAGAAALIGLQALAG